VHYPWTRLVRYHNDYQSSVTIVSSCDFVRMTTSATMRVRVVEFKEGSAVADELQYLSYPIRRDLVS
jgi:hypothetical protein